MLNFEAVIFDLDGVITQTAHVHAGAWKRTFDSYLRNREARLNEAFVEFTHASDYLPFVDGKPRYEGVAREDNEEELSANGADIVVKDLEDISFESIHEYFKSK